MSTTPARHFMQHWHKIKRFAIAAVVSAITAGWASCFAEVTEKPNILWLTCEDAGPDLGCYGDPFATTPNLDRLAARGLRYLACWSNAPVCAPARTAIITGMYPASLGAHHMRSLVPLPDRVELFPQILRRHGYYCTNNQKQDYNVIPRGKVWDQSSGTAHWKNRAEGQPFFAVFNFTATHESQIRTRPHTAVHDPAAVPLPSYHPDMPEVRLDWAQYYDRLTEVDRQVGEKLSELEQAGLAKDTIVFFFSDHGCGMPDHKRSPKNRGMHVPLIVYVPEKFAPLQPAEYAAGMATGRLVSFVDLGPTTFSLLDIKAPDYWQGSAFMGPHDAGPQNYLFASRDRMDERCDMSRSVRDQRYVLIRNFFPEKPAGQHLQYQFQTPTARIWHDAFQTGMLNPTQARFWKAKPPIEIYDLHLDPQEINNLALQTDREAESAVVRRLDRVLLEWMVTEEDLGFVPESEMHRRSQGNSPYQAARERTVFALPQNIAAAYAALQPDRNARNGQLASFLHPQADSASKYWALVAIARKPELFAGLREPVLKCSDDPSPAVQVVAAQCLVGQLAAADVQVGLARLLELADLRHQSVYTVVEALNALGQVDTEMLKQHVQRIADLPTESTDVPARMRMLVPQLVEKILADTGPAD